MPHYALKARVYKCAGPIANGALLWLASIAASRGRRRDMADVRALVVELGTVRAAAARRVPGRVYERTVADVRRV